ncbi:hypothetical protein TBLA_0B09960 [Henningerozyma blattae CBS 6284]|uniref:chitin deacetylase n=1 Tax=Henningerozyma blattae (strain ATCC 34711 / CBS 6284 / DSM 70876 / NBRC 10599 / NRRL Y-10934 / UCD 77-7) TaxID=1071380 RepID=I2H0B2_HENB6|nr:hypothetical protein TBLA_0B09960 [Tetrapisispora blattae CBS 6284]CCH59814.1 hypothetical protein TBLA_0B09960 [Tetrapisispora blattae CBS 6284]
MRFLKFNFLYLFLLSLLYNKLFALEENDELVEATDFKVANGKARTPFPDWLKRITGLYQWPGLDPPYIPLDFIDLSKIPDFGPYSLGFCANVPREACSFDCHGCMGHDEIFTCRKLSQTFDDGPTPATLRLLDSLDHETTFFNLGVNIVEHPDIYHRIQDDGHLIGSHTWSHRYLPALSNKEIIAQIEWGIWAMNATGHHIPKWWRPPYGGIDNRVRHITRLFGLQAVVWNHDTLDWKFASGDPSVSLEEILGRVHDWNRDKTGLILEHDSKETTVDIALRVKDIIGEDQLTVAECAGGNDYIREYD